jgi:HTH-type transcriptional regulator/antitoxin HigA
LKPIHDSVGHDNACEMIDALSGLDLNEEQEDYLEALTILLEAYECQLTAEDVGNPVSGLEALRFLCEENALSGGKLATLLGVSRALGVKLLSGERKLTVAHIQKLAERFKVSPNLFLG